MDDLLLEFTEYFNVYASPAGDDYRFVEVAPDRSTATIFITDDESKQQRAMIASACVKTLYLDLPCSSGVSLWYLSSKRVGKWVWSW